MKIHHRWSLLLVLIPLGIGVARAADERVEFIGDYSSIESATGEHCKGYSVTLWKYKASLIGFIHHHRGLCGDPPMGLMEDTSYSTSTGSLSFSAKLSDGVTTNEAGKWVPTKDKVTFKGKLQGPVLKGVVSWQRDGETEFRRENVTLSVENSSDQNFDNYDEWMKFWRPILKFRGPQWE
jgi:hypothetical protein